MCSKVAFSHLLFHPCAVPPGLSCQEALDRLVTQMNHLAKQETDLHFVLENSAHGKRSLGGNINELAYVQARLDVPEKVSICIDMAHAYVFGYTVHEESSVWIEMVSTLLTPQAILMLHLNDTQAVKGSFDDRHYAPGKGTIGVAALKNSIGHPHMQAKPVIIELPSVTDEEQRLVLEDVRSWE